MVKFKRKHLYYVVFGIGAMAIIVLLWNFWSIFGKRPLPTVLEKWAYFSDFLSLIIAMLNLMLFFILTMKAADLNEYSYKRQLMAQKSDLITSFRKSQLNDIQNQLKNIEELTNYNLNDKEELVKFKRSAELLKRSFAIYENNRNERIIGTLSFSDIVNALNKLCDYTRNIKEVDRNNINDIQEQLFSMIQQVNTTTIEFYKQYLDFTIDELENNFKVSEIRRNNE